MTQAEKWKRRIRLKRISNIIIIILALLSTAAVLVTIYGANVGNFVITVYEEEEFMLAISDNPDFSNPLTRLTATGLDEMRDSTLSQIDLVSAQQDGSNNSPSRGYFAYTFYAKNVSPQPVAIDYNVEILDVTKNVDGGLRTMLIVDGVQSIYAKVQGQNSASPGSPENYPYQTIPFVDARTICQETIPLVPVDGVVKITIVFWLEGWDADTVDEIKGGTIRMDMGLTATSTN